MILTSESRRFGSSRRDLFPGGSWWRSGGIYGEARARPFVSSRRNAIGRTDGAWDGVQSGMRTVFALWKCSVLELEATHQKSVLSCELVTCENCDHVQIIFFSQNILDQGIRVNLSVYSSSTTIRTLFILTKRRLGRLGSFFDQETDTLYRVCKNIGLYS